MQNITLYCPGSTTTSSNDYATLAVVISSLVSSVVGAVVTIITVLCTKKTESTDTTTFTVGKITNAAGATLENVTITWRDDNTKETPIFEKKTDAANEPHGDQALSSTTISPATTQVAGDGGGQAIKFLTDFCSNIQVPAQQVTMAGDAAAHHTDSTH
jgi:hypothetical protein